MLAPVAMDTTGHSLHCEEALWNGLHRGLGFLSKLEFTKLIKKGIAEDRECRKHLGSAKKELTTTELDCAGRGSDHWTDKTTSIAWKRDEGCGAPQRAGLTNLPNDDGWSRRNSTVAVLVVVFVFVCQLWCACHCNALIA